MIRTVLVAALLIPSLALGRINLPPMFTKDQIATAGLTEIQAQQVVALILKHQRMKYRGKYWFIETVHHDGGPFVPGYITISPSYDPPSAAAAAPMGLYAVSPLTGDVWEVDTCTHYDFPELRRVQQMISQRTGKTIPDEAHDRVGLGCE